jgi:hypothetical protein
MAACLSAHWMALVAVLVLLLAAPAAAAVHGSGTDDLARMVKLVASWSGANCRDPSWTAATPVCNWSIVTCVDDAVNTIALQVSNCAGLVPLAYLPMSTQYVRLNYNYFNGTLDFPATNPGLLELTLTDNNFSGPMNLTKLTGTIIDLVGNPGLCGVGAMNVECRDITLPNHCTCNYSHYDCGTC